MTLKTRNRTIVTFAAISAVILIAVFVIFFTRIFNDSFYNIFHYKFFSPDGFSLVKPSAKSVIISLLCLQIYITVTSFLLFYNFEKTQSPIIILFCIFLFGNQLELSRFFIALFDLSRTFSEIYLLFGKYAFLGKILCAFSFFLIAVESRHTQKLDIELDLVILFTISVFVTFCIPFNTAVTTSTFAIRPGFYKIVLLLFIASAILTIISFVMSYRETETKAILTLLAGYCHIVVGQLLLLENSILLLNFAGLALLIVGTNFFLRTLHKMYLWD